MSWRQGLYWYVGIGLALGAVAVPVALLKKRKDSLADSISDALYPERRTPWYRFRERVLLPLLILPLMGLAWPILMFVIGLDAWQNRKSQRASLPEDAPELTATDLLEDVDIATVEAAEHVTDPLGAVPALPFGHLHAAWLAFLDKRQPDEKLWRYQATHARSWGGPETRRGYAWVHDRQVGAHFRTYRRARSN
jgi:hypothetical protein